MGISNAVIAKEDIKTIDIEYSILGSIIVDNTLAYKLEDISSNMFSNSNKDIFNVMKELYNKGYTLDIPTIKTKLNERQVQVSISDITNLASRGETYAIDTHIEILKDKFIRKSIKMRAMQLITDILENKEIDTSLYMFENDVRSIVDDEVEIGDDISSICANTLDFLENREDTGLKFGVKFLDDVIGGLFKGELTTIAARSGVGKTALALQIMLMCKEQGKKVLFISREMSKEQIFMRNLSKKTGISAKSFKCKNLKEIDWKNIIDAMNELSKNNLIYINDRISTIPQLKKRIRQVKPDLVIVDYVQLLSNEQNLQTREREVATLSRELKNITLDYEIPLIQLSQLNDEMKDLRPWGERPMRDSKAIFHDSNNVVYIHEPVLNDFDKAVETIKKDRKSILKAREEGIKIVDLIVAKCRDGETKFRHYCYNGLRLHFQYLDY